MIQNGGKAGKGATNRQSLLDKTKKSTRKGSVSMSMDVETAGETQENVFTLRRNRFAFFFVGLTSLSLQAFANSIAAKALGSGDRTAIIMLSLYLPQVILRVYTDYWTRWFSYHLRIIMAAVLASSGLILLYLFVEESSDDDEGKSILHYSRLAVVLSMILMGMSSTVGSVTACGYTAFFEPQCVNTSMAGAGFGSLLGAAMVFLKAWLTDIQVVLACLSFPIGLLLSYFSLKHPDRDTRVNRKEAKKKATNTTSTTDATDREVGAWMTMKLLFTSLFKYTFPMITIYFLYNILLSGFMGPSFDVRHDGRRIKRYETVFPYFLFTLRLGIFFGKSSGFLQIRKFMLFPLAFSIGTLFCGVLAFAPNLMYWFNHSQGGFWVLWMLALPIGWTYGATPASVMIGIRVDAPEDLKEFGLANITSAAIYGHTIGNIVAIMVAHAVPKREI